MNFIQSKIKASIEVKESIIHNDYLVDSIAKAAKLCIKSLRNGGKVLFCGNGGSAADSQHLASELSGRFYKDRKPLFAEALTVNTSYITAIANDYCFEDIYSRLVLSKGKSGDILIGLSTSGNSENIVRAFKQATKLQMKTIAFTGKKGGKLNKLSDILINVPSTDTPRIQESHILVGHIICEIVENEMF